MSTFNKVFSTVQQHCLLHGSVSGNQDFRSIALQLAITVERLHFYLDCLQETGVIRYSAQNKTIELTEKGSKAGSRVSG
jgi:predicted transcriptional regulator